MKMFNPADDGKTHINIYSKGATWLGRQLTNFAKTPFEHSEDGHFDSVEGYWYWLSCKDDKLRKLSGFAAKQYGREVGAADWVNTPEFRKKIRQAIKAKLKTHSKIRKALAESALPFTHYYVYGGKVVDVPEANWILRYLEKKRLELQNK